MALFVKLDTTWPDDDRVIEAGIDGAGGHAIAMCLAKRLETDGWIGRRLLARYGVSDGLCDRLVDVGLLHSDGDKVRPAGWHSRNPSQGAIDASRESKREAGKRGNHARYNHRSEFADCEICHGKPTSSQGASASARTISQESRTPLAPPSPESDTESESESDTSTTESQVYSQPAEPDPGPVVVDQQTILEAVAKVARTYPPRPDVDPGAWAGGIAKQINLGPDTTRLDEITRRLEAGESPDEIAGSWAEPDPLMPPGSTRCIDPADVAAAAERAKRLEADTAERLAAARTAEPAVDGVAAARQARAHLRPVPDDRGQETA